MITRRSGNKRATKSWTRFLTAIALVCGAAYAAAYAVGMSPAYCAYSRSQVDAAPCYKYDLRGISVEILLVGDSALLYGIRPSLIRRTSGISTYNYGMVGPSFTFDPQAVIDHYLATNARPAGIVIYLSPWSQLTRHRITDPQWFPIAVLTLRHGTWIDFLNLFGARPSAAVEIPSVIVRSIGLSSVPSTDRRIKMERADGYFDYAANLDAAHLALSEDCDSRNFHAVRPYAADNRRALAELRSHYASLGLPLYVYVAPTPPCDAQIESVRATYAGAADNLPATLPNKYFADDSPFASHTHLNSDGVIVASELLADFLMNRQSASKDK